MFFAFTWSFSEAKAAKLRRLKQQLSVLLFQTFWYWKNVFSKFLIEPFRIAAPKRPCPRLKILEESTWHDWDWISQRRKGSSNITVSRKNMKNDVSHAMCERRPLPMSSTTPPKKRRIALKSTICGTKLFQLCWITLPVEWSILRHKLELF